MGDFLKQGRLTTELRKSFSLYRDGEERELVFLAAPGQSHESSSQAE